MLLAILCSLLLFLHGVGWSFKIRAASSYARLYLCTSFLLVLAAFFPKRTVLLGAFTGLPVAMCISVTSLLSWRVYYIFYGV
jgi:hypothetical protein